MFPNLNMIHNCPGCQMNNPFFNNFNNMNNLNNFNNKYFWKFRLEKYISFLKSNAKYTTKPKR